jgi:hypothetical protein
MKRGSVIFLIRLPTATATCDRETLIEEVRYWKKSLPSNFRAMEYFPFLELLEAGSRILPSFRWEIDSSMVKSLQCREKSHLKRQGIEDGI